MFELFLFLLGFTAGAPDDIAWDPVACDDGSAPWHGTLPNWDCELYECTPLDSLCWPDRLSGCLAADGSDNGACQLQKKTCNSRLTCFNLWVHCTGGTYECHEDDPWIGCKGGSCRSALVPDEDPPRGLGAAPETQPFEPARPQATGLASRRRGAHRHAQLSADSPREEGAR